MTCTGSPSAALECGSQRFVAAHDFVERFVQGLTIQFAGQPECRRNVVSRIAWLQLFQYPEALLSERRRRLTDSGLFLPHELRQHRALLIKRKRIKDRSIARSLFLFLVFEKHQFEERIHFGFGEIVDIAHPTAGGETAAASRGMAVSWNSAADAFRITGAGTSS